MYEAYGWWFPDEDTHFKEMLAKAVAKGLPAEYQQHARKRSIKLVEDKSVALDIGANVGLWSKELTKYFDKVIAFEPIKQFRDCLIKNVPADNLEIYECALGSQNDQIEMVITEGNTGHSHVDPNSFGRGHIEIRRLDDIELPAFTYCKIDCEGYEVPILIGGRETILRNKPIMVVEQKKHKDLGKTNQFDAVELLLSWGAKRLTNVRHDIILGW